MSKTNTPDIVAGKPFSAQVAELERGVLDHDLTSEMNNLVRAVRKTGAGGKLSLTIKVKPNNIGGTQVTLESEIKTTLPKSQREKSLAFTTESGALVKNDPRQMEMDGLHE
jgi:hypothetical protein